MGRLERKHEEYVDSIGRRQDTGWRFRDEYMRYILG